RPSAEFHGSLMITVNGTVSPNTASTSVESTLIASGLDGLPGPGVSPPSPGGSGCSRATVTLCVALTDCPVAPLTLTLCTYSPSSAGAVQLVVKASGLAKVPASAVHETMGLPVAPLMTASTARLSP